MTKARPRPAGRGSPALPLPPSHFTSSWLFRDLLIAMETCGCPQKSPAGGKSHCCTASHCCLSLVSKAGCSTILKSEGQFWSARNCPPGEVGLARGRQRELQCRPVRASATLAGLSWPCGQDFVPCHDLCNLSPLMFMVESSTAQRCWLPQRAQLVVLEFFSESRWLQATRLLEFVSCSSPR